ncbi:hypothetical protein H0A73_17490 [Alcaligenaceae bacterium]|nr:hypothetical protein [Alcaligenaceae bacterium]
MATKKTAPVAVPSSIVTDDLFVTDDIIEEEVTLGDGSKRTMYFKQLSAAAIKQHFAAERSKVRKVRDGATARLIARSLVEQDGRQALTAEQAARLKPVVSGAFYFAILKVNGIMQDVPAAPVSKADSEDEDDDDIDLGLDDDGEGEDAVPDEEGEAESGNL